jgi:hypothetical protein
MWDILKIDNFDTSRNDYNLGLAPEVSQGFLGDCTIISAMSSLAKNPAKI